MMARAEIEFDPGCFCTIFPQRWSPAPEKKAKIEDSSIPENNANASIKDNESHHRTLFYMALNIGSSVGIVLSNKWIFQHHKFEFGTLLTVIHFLVTFIGLELCALFGLFQKKKIPLIQVLPLSISFCSFVVLTNLSLQYNSVGFYQMAKVLTTPCIVLLQSRFHNVQFSNAIKAALAVTCGGVIVVSVNDFQLNFIGTVFALAGVVAGSFYQIWVGTKQKELNINSMQLLYHQSSISFVLLSLCIPLLDNATKIYEYEHTTMSLSWILISACLAFFVNLSTFLIIGKTSPVTYNMVGHFKLCVILLLGFIIFQYPVDIKQIGGISITLAGIFWYSKLKLASAADLGSK